MTEERKIVDSKVAFIALQCLEIMRAFPESDAAKKASDLINKIHQDKFGKSTE